VPSLAQAQVVLRCALQERQFGGKSLREHLVGPALKANGDAAHPLAGVSVGGDEVHGDAMRAERGRGVSIDRSIDLSIYLSISVSVSVSISIYLSIYIQHGEKYLLMVVGNAGLAVYSYLYLYLYPSIYLSIYLSISIYIYRYIYIYRWTTLA
jgi:hypothetical protein